MKISKSLKIISLTALVGMTLIGCGEKVTFKGQDYKVITSPITGKKWLDRNLGANQACTSSTDKACYGDYYQWGRLADGHEKTSSSLSTSMVKDVSDIGKKFIVKFKDWTTSDTIGDVRKVQWSKIDGTGVCPVGFRVPTQTELRAETIGYSSADNISIGAVKVTNAETAFQNFLKLPVAGVREAFDGSIKNSVGFLWTIAVNNSNSQFIGYGSGNAKSDVTERAMGLSIRCIESKTSDEIDTIPPQITSTSSYSVPENKISSFTIVANDDSNIAYSLEGVDSSYFTIDSSTGEFKFKTEPDYETKNSYSIIIKVRDSEDYSSSQSITINITDEIDKFTRDNTKEIVIDNFTKLQWQDDSTAKTIKVNWDTATTSTCQNLTLGGYSDWRLPTIEELKSILKNRRISNEFLNLASYYYWSSTTNASNSSNACHVGFNAYYGDWSNKTDSNYVRCVRAGE
jgi:uncharacterized protein (TIGR02145 family)